MISHSKSSKNWISPKISVRIFRSRYLQAGEIKKRCEAVGELGWNIPWTVAPRWLAGCGTHLLWLFFPLVFSKSEFEVKGGCIHSCHVDFSSESHIILYQKKHGFSTFMWIFLLVTHIFPNERLGICSWTWKAGIRNSLRRLVVVPEMYIKVQYPRVSFS